MTGSPAGHGFALVRVVGPGGGPSTFLRAFPSGTRSMCIGYPRLRAVRRRRRQTTAAPAIAPITAQATIATISGDRVVVKIQWIFTCCVFITANSVMKTMATPAIRRRAHPPRVRAGRFDPALAPLRVVSEPVPANDLSLR